MTITLLKRKYFRNPSLGAWLGKCVAFASKAISLPKLNSIASVKKLDFILPYFDSEP